MKLYHNPASPFVRKVRVTAAELGMTDRIELLAVTITPTAPGDQVPAKNPLGKIPALERDGGPTIYDSPVICRYLDDLAGGRLYPGGARLWETLTLEATADGIMDAAVLMVYEGRVRPQELHYAAWIEAQWSKVARALDALEARWMAHLAGPLDIGQIATGCALGYLDFRHGGRDWRGSRPALARWFETFGQRPSMVATQPG